MKLAFSISILLFLGIKKISRKLDIIMKECQTDMDNNYLCYEKYEIMRAGNCDRILVDIDNNNINN